MLEGMLEPSEEREEGRAGWLRALWAMGELWALPRAGGEPGELWTEDGPGFCLVFTGALWWLLLGGQTGGRRDCSSRKEVSVAAGTSSGCGVMRGNFL